MSGVVKSVGKVFKKVVKTVKKILPAALGIGALVFTAGAALGVLPSWGAAVSQLTSSLGAGSTLTNVLTGAVTQAGYGAALGGATAALTGGDIGKGAGIGALTGAATGGVMGGLGFETDPLRGLNEQPASAAPGQAGQVGPLGSDRGTTVMTGGPAAGPTPGPLMTQGAPPTAGVPASGAGVAAPGGWLERNQTLVGSAVGGLGSGLLAGLEDSGDEGRKTYETRARIIQGNYGSGGSGLLAEGDTAYMAGATTRPTPAEKFDPRAYPGSWQYDQSAGRLIWVPNQQYG